MLEFPVVRCPSCNKETELDKRVITAQSNQNIIFTCLFCGYMERNIETNKG
ncbi:putative Zn finger protein [Peribacillus deserti]|uniref:Zn finger protein n=1 Tax=Peribacillus deserti TaxID=673318 RepID=A0ABS2QN67_9BACI|nr:putative Zn finger protein [Peribacillus deserti]